MSYFIFKQLPILPPEIYMQPCAWHRGISERDGKQTTIANWLLPRVIELVYTSVDLSALAADLGYDGKPFSWDEDRRFTIRCELDAAFFYLYDVACEDLDYIMESFPLVKRKDEQRFGEYRTKRVILEIYNEMVEAAETGSTYRTRLSPPPADPSLQHYA